MKKFDYRDMDEGQSLGQARPRSAKATKTIPFDYVFKFDLKGERGNKVQDVIQISIEGVFVSTTVGYSLVTNEETSFPPVVDQTTIPQNPVLIPFFTEDGDGSLDRVILAGIPGAEVDLLDLSKPSPEDIIISTETIEADGTATVNFEPDIQNAVLRVWDRTNNLLSELFQVGLDPLIVDIPLVSSAESLVEFPPSTPVIGLDPTNRKLPAVGDTTVFVYGTPNTTVSVILFQGKTGIPNPVVKNDRNETEFTLESRTPFEENRHTGLIPVPLKVVSDNGMVKKALSPGDFLLVQLTSAVQVTARYSVYTVPRPKPSTLSVRALSAGLERIGTDLTRGFRINPKFVNVVEADLPLDQMSPDILDKIFQTGCSAAEEVSFLYSIDSVGTGREFQSQPIHNIAGLGIANGDRPFRPFAKPIMFEPRSSIRIQIEELSGPPGKLFIVLQGYKILGTGEIPR